MVAGVSLIGERSFSIIFALNSINLLVALVLSPVFCSGLGDSGGDVGRGWGNGERQRGGAHNASWWDKLRQTEGGIGSRAVWGGEGRLRTADVIMLA